MAIWKLATPDGPRLASGPVAGGPQVFLPSDVTIDTLLKAGRSDQLLETSDWRGGDAVPPGMEVCAPIDSQEVWAAGVTYRRSRSARMAESRTPDHYDHVYESDRPELFFKSVAWRVRSSEEAVGIRSDSEWDVPEPELAVIADSNGDIVAYTIGNDMSSRSIEGTNPLYLPQAKIYADSVALGPCLVPLKEALSYDQLTVSLRVVRNGTEVVVEEVSVGSMKRTPHELVDWLFCALEFPAGAVLLTGTGIVPDAGFSLREGDEIAIGITGLGELRNTVRTVKTKQARHARHRATE